MSFFVATVITILASQAKWFRAMTKVSDEEGTDVAPYIQVQQLPSSFVNSCPQH